MDIKELMIELNDNKIHAVDIYDNKKTQEFNRKLHLVKRQYIEKAKVYMPDDNDYRKYLIENLERVKLNSALNITVKTTQEAISLLEGKIDMRLMFGIGSHSYAEIFDSEVFYEEEYYEGIEATKEEAELAMSKIINNKDGFIKIKYSIQEQVALGKYTYWLSLYTSKLKAYISFNTKNKKQLYFIKSTKDSNDYSYNIYLTIIELTEICFKCKDQYSSIKKLCQLLNVKIEYEENQVKKYENNLKVLNEDYIIESKYPILFGCLKYHGDFLKVINIYGQELINFSDNNYLDENFFCFSNDFIGGKAINSEIIDKMLNFGKGTVNSKINLFCVLGLLEKVSFKELPEKYRHRAIGYKKEENYYIISSYTVEVLNEAEKRLSMIKNAKVKATKLSGAKCRAIFGEELYGSVYGNYYKVVA